MVSFEDIEIDCVYLIRRPSCADEPMVVKVISIKSNYICYTFSGSFKHDLKWISIETFKKWFVIIQKIEKELFIERPYSFELTMHK